jgi:hypothetical protein
LMCMFASVGCILFLHHFFVAVGHFASNALELRGLGEGRSCD